MRVEHDECYDDEDDWTRAILAQDISENPWFTIVSKDPS